MKGFILGGLVFFSFFASAQTTCVLKGSLVDTAGQLVPDAVLVLMTRADSAQLKVEYCQDGAFELTWTDEQARETMLYVSAIGYNGRYIDVDPSHSDLGKIILTPWAVSMGEVTVSARTPIGHKFERGRDEYTVPAWLREQSYDLNSLLMMIPGLITTGNQIEIAGIGKPIYLIDNMNPRGGELENLNPKDIEKVTIIRMPGARFSKGVLGIISIETKKKWHDYFSVRLNNDFKYSNEVNNTSGMSLNFKKNKLSQFLIYNYMFLPKRSESWDIYETNIPEKNIYYLMASDMKMYEKDKRHVFIYSPKYQFNSHSYVDVQYIFLFSDSEENNLTRTSFSDGNESDLQSWMLGDNSNKGHRVTLRYDNWFGDEAKARLIFNTSYSMNIDKDESILVEKSVRGGELIDTSFTCFHQDFRNEVLTSSIAGEFTLWDAMKVESGVSYDNLWTRSTIDYQTKDYLARSRTRNEQLAIYLNADHQIGKFHYQVGIRGEYERRYGVNAGGGNESIFYFLPTVGMSYQVNDNFNFMLYYRREVNYPTTSQLNTNILYFHKYMYNTGNALLNPTVSNSLMTNFSFPMGLALTCKYAHKKNDILLCSQSDENTPDIIVIRPENLDKTKCLDFTLTWKRSMKWYHLNLMTGYMQYFVRSPFIEDASCKPQFIINANHSFTINSYIRAGVIMHYESPYSYFGLTLKQKYIITPQIYFSLLKNRLNIRLAGDYLIHSGNHYEKAIYNHTTSICEMDYHVRSISIGISYNFNNFQELFRKNEAGSEMFNRTE